METLIILIVIHLLRTKSNHCWGAPHLSKPLIRDQKYKQFQNNEIFGINKNPQDHPDWQS